MTTEIQNHETTTLLIMTPPAELDAGSDMALKVSVSCALGCALSNQSVHIVDQDGTLVTEIKFASNGESTAVETLTVQPPPQELGPNGTIPAEERAAAATNETEEFVIKTPIKPGEYTWTALFPGHEEEGITHQASSAVFSFIVKPHKTSMTVWDVPSPVVMGNKFTIKAGVLCSAGCKLTGKAIDIFDARGAKVGTAVLSEEPWSPAGPLYWTEAELTAPAAQEVYDWNVKFSVSETNAASPEESEHLESTFPFAFATAPAPDHLVQLQVIDKQERTPVANADVALFPESGFPYRTRTNASGVATVNVSKGNYEITVAMMDYDNFKTTARIDEDVTIQAEFVYHPDLGG